MAVLHVWLHREHEEGAGWSPTQFPWRWYIGTGTEEKLWRAVLHNGQMTWESRYRIKCYQNLTSLRSHETITYEGACGFVLSASLCSIACLRVEYPLDTRIFFGRFLIRNNWRSSWQRAICRERRECRGQEMMLKKISAIMTWRNSCDGDVWLYRRYTIRSRFQVVRSENKCKVP